MDALLLLLFWGGLPFPVWSFYVKRTTDWVFFIYFFPN